MKRVIALLLCFLLLAGALVSCAEKPAEEKHTHTYSAKWTSDANGHWYDATCDCTDAPIKKLAHTDDNNDGMCDVCKYTSHEHTYSEEWTVDCTNHWHAADCGHTVAGTDLYVHTDADNDGKCDVCKYVIDDIHVHYYDSAWTTDREYHWHAALCEHGVEVADKAAHELNAAGICTVCDTKIKDVNVTDIEAVLAAAAAMNHKVVSGNVLYINTIPDIDYSNEIDVYYVLGNGSSYVKRYEYGISKQTWYQYISEEEVFGVTTEDGGITIIPVSADQDNLSGYEYMASTLADAYTVDGILSELYAFTKAETAKNVVVRYDAATGLYSFSFEYLDVQILTGNGSLTDSGNDESTAETIVDISTHLYFVEASFKIDDNFVITEADFTVGAMNDADFDRDYVYNAEDGTYTILETALADTYSYKIAQESGDRTYYTEYPKSSLVPFDFDLVYPDGTAADVINTTIGQFTRLDLGNLKPFSALPEFLNLDDLKFTVVNNADENAETFEPYYDPYGQCVQFYPTAEGSYTMTVAYGEWTKTYTINAKTPAPSSISAYKFADIDGYDGPVYTVDQYNPGPTSTISLEIGEYVDFLVRVSPVMANQNYTITVDNGGTITEVTLENVIAFYENLETCTAHRFTAETEGVYVITMTSVENPEITGTLTVYVGVEEELETSAEFTFVTPGDFEKTPEQTFIAPIAGNYVITAEGLDATTWFQHYNEIEDSWTRMNDLPYTKYLEAGERLVLRLYGWTDDAAVVGTAVTVNVALEGEGGGDIGGGEVGTGSGTYDDPYIIAVGDQICNYPGQYESIFYSYYLTEGGYVKVNSTASVTINLTNDYGANGSNVLGYDDDWNAIFGESAMVYAPAGTVVTISFYNDLSEDPSTIAFSLEFLPISSEDLTPVAGKWVYNMDGIKLTLVLNADGTGTYIEDWGWMQTYYTINYAFLNGFDLMIGATDTDGYKTSMQFVCSADSIALDDYIFTKGEGGDDPITPPTEGTLDNPIMLYEGGDIVCAFPGGYNNVYYAVPVRMGGYVTVSSTDANAWIAAGLDPNTVMYNGTNTVKVYVPFGYTCYIAVSTQEGNAADVSFNVNFEPFFSDDYTPFIGTWVADSGSYLTINEYAMGTYVESAWWGTVTYSIEYLVVNGNNILIGVIDEYTNRITLNLTYLDGALTTVPQSPIEMPITFVPGTVVVEPENNDLVLGNYEIAAKDETLIYKATANGTLTLTMGAAIMGPVSVTYSINGAEAVEIPLSSSASLTLVAGDEVVITITAAGYSSITSSFEEAGADVPHEHSYIEVVVGATCTSDGLITKTCECGDVQTEVIPATGHNYVDGTCTACGAADPNAPATEFGVVDTPKADTAYKFGMIQENVGKTYYLKGGMDGYYLATTDNKDLALDVYLEVTDGGYYLYCYVNGAKTYINMVVSGTHVNGAYQAAASTVYRYDAEAKTLIAVVNGADYWFGTRNDKTYTTAGPCAVSYKGFYCQFYGEVAIGGGSDTPHEHVYTETKADATCTVDGLITKTCECGDVQTEVIPATGHNYVDGTCTACGAADPNAPATEFGVVDTPKADTAYKFGMIQENVGKTYYLKGGMDGYYLATTDNKDLALDVYLEVTDGGYYLYCYVNGAKTYINMVVSGTHVNGAYQAAASTVYRYDAEAKTLIAVVNGADYWFGTRNDKTYTTAGPCAVSYKGFYCQFYGETTGGTVTPDPTPDPEPHVHVYVEKKTDATCTVDGLITKTCECGDVQTEVIPATGHNYVDGTCANCGDVKADGGDTPDIPVVGSDNAADLDAIILPSNKPNGDSSYTGTYNSANGWVSTNSAIQTGGATVINPQFPVIGPDNTHKAVCLNGKVSAPGKLTSPTLTTGISKLTINYTKMFTDTELSATVTITDAAGNKYTHVIAQTLPKDEKYVVYTDVWTLDTPVVGDFTIEIVNNCPSGATGNKDRMTILDVIWEGAVAAHTHSYTEVKVDATCTEDGSITKTCECGDVQTEVIPATGHVDANLDIKCDVAGCGGRLFPDVDSEISLHVANALRLFSLNGKKYYMQGKVTEVTDAKNGVFVITDDAGDSLIIRLPKDADGNAYSTFAQKVTLGDTVKIYGTPVVNSTSGATVLVKVEGGALTILEHSHVFADATCDKGPTCGCGYTEGNPAGHTDTDGNGTCDVCTLPVNATPSALTTHTSDKDSFVLNDAGTAMTWGNDVFSAEVGKGTASVFDSNKSEEYVRLRKNSTFTVTAKGENTIKAMVITSTSASYAAVIQTALSAAGYTATVTDDFKVIVNCDLSTITLTMGGTTRIAAIVVYC